MKVLGIMKGYLLLMLVCLASIPLIHAGRRTGGSRSGSSSSSSSRSGGSRSGGYYSSSSNRYGSSGSSSSSSSRRGGSRSGGYVLKSISRPGGSRSVICSSILGGCDSSGDKGYSSSGYKGYSSAGVCNNTSNYTMKGYGTRWGTDFTNATRNMDYSNKKVGLGVGPGFIGGAQSGPIPTFAVYHRYNKYRELMYYYTYGYGIEAHVWSGNLGFGSTYYKDYYLADRCTSPCPYPSVCRHGLCVCPYGYKRLFGRCSRDWRTEPYRPRRNFDPLSQPCINNQMCWDYDFNLVCNLNITRTEGRCECRNDMAWNAEKYECQLYLDVDCSRITYDTLVDDVIEEAVENRNRKFYIRHDELEDVIIEEAVENRIENFNQTGGSEILTLSREYNHKTSLFESIDPRRLTKDLIIEAFCRDVDAFSYEFSGLCYNNDGIGSELSGIMNRDPSIGEYFLEAIDLMNRTQWRFFLPDDTDIDQDGNLSDLEVQHKFNTYMGELFKLIDDDKDNSIGEEEFRSLKLNIPQLTKTVDIALENFPLRPFFLAADGNGDGFYDKNDFYLPDNKSKIDRGLNKLIGWDLSELHTHENYVIWEETGRFLFICDTNGDGKLSLEELAMKAKEVMTKILEFLDGNQDGKISLDDFTSPNLPVGSIHNLMTELFDDVTAGQGELDLFDMKMARKFFKNGLKGLDKNKDKKVNAADVFWRLGSREKAIFLIPMLSQKLDKNQDGKIRRVELRQFTDEMFNQVDMDKNGNLTLEDAYSFMRENGFDCFQVGALRSFIKVLLDTIDTQTRNFFGYVFKQFDIDGNGQITPQELEKMHVPCDMSRRHLDNDDNSNNSSDSNVRLPCEQIFHNFFDLGDLFRGFPNLEMDSGRHGGYGGYGRYGGGGHHQSRRKSILDKMTNTACEMLY